MTIILAKIMLVLMELAANLWGTVQHPYLTWKKIIREGNLWASLCLLLLFSSYFGVREPIRWGNIRWYGIVIHELSASTVKLWIQVSGGRFLMSMVTFFFVCGVMVGTAYWVSDKLRGDRLSGWLLYKRVVKVWIYSYLPTVLWFALTAWLFTLLPPPRRPTYSGFLFSGLYLTVSLGLAIWKWLLYYLTLRLALKLQPKEIFIASALILPTVAIYAQILYWLNIFKLPFI